MLEAEENITADIEAVGKISVIPSLLEVICRTTGMGFAAVARVTENRWVACLVRDEIQFGLKPGGELQLESTICHEIRQSGEGVIIDHVAEDPHFAAHHTPKMYGFQSYISIPIRLRNGEFFGTLCAIDPRPAKLNDPAVIGMFRLFADLISFHLNVLDELVRAEEKLVEEKKMSDLREQFIAILGHDLRNPLSAISNSAQLLQQLDDNADVQALAAIIRNSSYRMSGLIENTLDFARGRLGGGLTLERKKNCSMEKVIAQIISELQTTSPTRIIETTLDLAEPVDCDETRIGQLFSNLLSNALTYSRKGTSIRVKVSAVNGSFSLSVTNCCDKIPQHVLDRIFQPFSRGEVRPGQQGLGLGLYIASEIARTHGGQLQVVSTREETTFTLSMPSHFF